MSHFNSSEIRNPGAYAAAVEARIRMNATKTRRAKWLSENADGERLYDWLNHVGEFADTCTCGAQGWDEHAYDCRTIHHPTTVGMFSGDFGKLLFKLQEDLDKWGHLSEKQTEIVRNALARTEVRLKEREARKVERLERDRATSKHVGVVGKREVFTLNVERVIRLDGEYGVSYIYLCKDVEGNVIVYKGTQYWEEPVVTVKATVKEHGEREGVMQTIIQRPTKV